MPSIAAAKGSGLATPEMCVFANEALALVQAPPEESKPLYVQYAALEEQYGLARSAMEVYDKAVKTVPVAERLTVYELYLARAHEYFGLGKVCLLL